MAEEKRNENSPKAPRQSWKPHWSLSVLQKTWAAVFGVVKIALGALATVLVIVGICMLQSDLNKLANA